MEEYLMKMVVDMQLLMEQVFLTVLQHVFHLILQYDHQ
jgi:hypothetical protein